MAWRPSALPCLLRDDVGGESRTGVVAPALPCLLHDGFGGGRALAWDLRFGKGTAVPARFCHADPLALRISQMLCLWSVGRRLLRCSLLLNCARFLRVTFDLTILMGQGHGEEETEATPPTYTHVEIKPFSHLAS